MVSATKTVLALGVLALTLPPQLAAQGEPRNDASTPLAERPGVWARLETTRGTAILELRADSAPVTVTNFANLSLKHFYDGLHFHRSMPSILMGGDPEESGGTGGPGYDLDVTERGKILHDSPGVISMITHGRKASGSQFLITKQAMPELDGQQLAFGHVREGQHVVDALTTSDSILSISVKGKGLRALLQSQRVRVATWNRELTRRSRAATVQQKRSREETARQLKAARNFLASRRVDLSRGVDSDSGLFSVVLKEGKGPLVSEDSRITAHVLGWLADGTRFWPTKDDDSQTLVDMPVSGFVAGFTEGMKTMKKGGRSVFIVPGDLGYGPKGNPKGKIPQNATLIFEVELTSMN